MPYGKTIRLMLIVCGLGVMAAQGAVAAPRELYDKAVTARWGESGVYKRLSDGVTVNPAGQFTCIFYLSDAGRLFTRCSSSNANGQHASSGDFGPEKTAPNVSFQGNTLVGTRVTQGVARRIVATFDAAFSGCSLSVTIGKAGPGARLRGFDKADYEVVSMQAGSTSCSVQAGNPFAGR
jgi:hypothetical protein